MSTDARNFILMVIGFVTGVALLAAGLIMYSNARAPRTPTDGDWVLSTATDWADCPDRSQSMEDGALETSCSNGLRAAVFWHEEDLREYMDLLYEEEVAGVIAGPNWVMVTDDPEVHLANLEVEEYGGQLAADAQLPEDWIWREPNEEMRGPEPPSSVLPWEY